ncbi:MAG: hypothetical protein AB8G05_28075 [Oligoflexales bacterium]
MSPFIVVISIIVAFIVLDKGVKQLDDHEEIKLQNAEFDQDGGFGYGEEG